MKKIYLLLTIFSILFSLNASAIGPIVGPANMCPGDVAQLSNATPGGTWSSSNPSIATISLTTGLVGVPNFPYSWGSAVITYATVSGSATHTITVATPGPIVGAMYICMGGTTYLSDTTAGGIWSVIGGVATISPTGMVTPVSTGSAIVRYTNSVGCFASTTITVTSSPCASVVPIATTLNMGCTYDTLKVPYYACTNYQWQSSPDNITWTNFGSPWYNTLAFIPTGNMYYRCAMLCTGTGGGSTVYSAPVLLTMVSPTLHTTVNTIPSTSCTALETAMSVCGAPGSYNVTTYFGDGSSNNVVLTTGGNPHGTVSHAYDFPGTYTVTHILYNGTTPVDTASYSYNYLYCRTLPVNLFLDNNSNCTKDAGEIPNLTPVDIEIDSAGVKIDTISVTSGFYYKAWGAPGTVYQFKLLSTAFSSSCSSGIVTATILPYVNTYSPFFLALQGSSSGSFDLTTNVTSRLGIHRMEGTITTQNLLSPSQPGVLTLNLNPQFQFIGSSPAPSSVTATAVTWNITGLSNMSTPSVINYHCEKIGSWMAPGDTVHTSFMVTPTIGDANNVNNYVIRVDTVKTGWDPNYIEADPAGYMLPGAQLKYTIHFENTGNDTAHNIHVMDTLSDNLDPSSLKIVTASHVMNMVQINDGTHNIVKFDFPNIKLPDSSHHYYSNGFVTYRIMQRPGLTDGTPIAARAGIYFDENEVVLTEPIQNTIAYINGPNTLCVGDHITLTELAPGGTWTSSSANATVAGGVVTGVAAGTAAISYTVNYNNGPITVTKLINIGAGGGSAGTIVGPTTVCAGTTIVLTNATSGGAWSTAVGNAMISGPVVTGMAAGTDTIIYTVGSGVCAARSTLVINVLPQPNPGTLSGASSVCPGASITVSPTVAGGVWSTFGVNVSITSGVSAMVTGITSGTDTVYYSVTNSCGTKSAKKVITINPLADPGVISGPASVYVGSTVNMTQTVTGGVWAMWGTHASISGGVVTGLTPGIDSVYYVVNNLCGARKASKAITIMDHPTGVGNTPQASDVVIYPNPTTGELTIADANGLYKTYTITNEVGQVITAQALKARQTNIDITKYAPGIYYITLKGDHGSVVKKISKI